MCMLTLHVIMYHRADLHVHTCIKSAFKYNGDSLVFVNKKKYKQMTNNDDE